jgi:hypothetical protein
MFLCMLGGDIWRWPPKDFHNNLRHLDSRKFDNIYFKYVKLSWRIYIQVNLSKFRVNLKG